MPRRRSTARWLLFVIALLSGACGGSSAPGAVSPATRDLVERAQVEERARQYDRARALLEQAVREAPNDPSAAFANRELASALLFWGDFEGARDALEALTESAPDSASAHHDLGVVRAKLGDERGAEESLSRACELAPGDARPRIALAALYVNQRRFDDAEPLYRELLKLELPEKLRVAVRRALELIAAEREGR